MRLIHCLTLFMIVIAHDALAIEKIFVSFYPLEYAVKAMIGDAAEVWNPVDSDPAEWSPTKLQVQKIQNCSLIFVNGAGFEKWLRIVSLPRSKLVETTRAFKSDWLSYHSKHAKAHSHGGKVHTHKGYDGHTWLSPNRFLMQMESIYLSLLKTKIVDQTQLEKRYDKIKNEFIQLDSQWKTLGKKLAKTGHVFTNHPAYNYLANDYGFKVRNFNISPDSEFSSVDKKEMKTALKEHRSSYFWWESPPSSP
ncbi:MAG: zinc ABC transporter substrate-binding protein [Oligoflexales bacterium]|nr:zinc ABC transporter substrate-binding protein [Oligoflexales bacterium]